MTKVIEQLESFGDVEIYQRPLGTIIIKQGEATIENNGQGGDYIYIQDSKAREVALAIYDFEKENQILQSKYKSAQDMVEEQDAEIKILKEQVEGFQERNAGADI